MTNIDFAAREAVYVAATAENDKHTKALIEQALLNATRKFLTQLGITELAVAKDTFTVADWIDFNKCDSGSGAPSDASSSSNVQSSNAQGSAANIIVSDQFAGTRLASQAAYSEPPAQRTPTEAPAVALPWREWFSFNTLSAVEADKATGCMAFARP